MSQMTAAARPLSVPRRPTAPAPLRILPTGLRRAGNGRFATICVLLLTVGLIALLLLNTALAQGSLALGTLQSESAVLSDTAANLQEQIDQASASGELARRAAALGMVRSNERAYIDLSAGTVKGTAQPATRNQAFPIVTSPTPPPPPPKQVTAATAAALKAAAAAALPKPSATQTPAPTASTKPSATAAPSPTASSAATSAPTATAPTPSGTR